MIIRFGVFFLICFFNVSNIFSQQVGEKTARKVYKEIIQAIGNINPMPPTLEFKSTKNNPASYNPRSSTIKIEYKVLQICYSFGVDSLNALSYILAHELGHHYQNHGYSTQYASLDFSNEIEESQESAQQRIDDETQADLYAGFYSHLAGYDALSVAKEFLDKIYKGYNLPEELKNYPTLSQRKIIVEKNKNDFEELKYIFDVANVNMAIGNYDIASKMLTYILNKGFTSREIYNNLGLCYVYQSLDLDLEDNYFNIIIPFKTDLNTRLETSSLSRSLNDKDQAIYLFNSAVKYFQIALQLDPNYSLAKENLYYANICLMYLGENIKNSYSKEEILDLDNVCEFCVKGHYEAYLSKERKAKSYFKKGAKECSICKANIDFKNKQVPEQKKKKLSEFEIYDLSLNGINMNCLDFKNSQDYLFYKKLNRLRMAIDKIDDVKLIKLKERINREQMCIAIQEYSNKNKNYVNDVNIYVDDVMDKITSQFSNISIFDTGALKFISLNDHDITFLLKNNKVHKWYYSKRLN